jgi:hypothetical protein
MAEKKGKKKKKSKKEIKIRRKERIALPRIVMSLALLYSRKINIEK